MALPRHEARALFAVAAGHCFLCDVEQRDPRPYDDAAHAPIARKDGGTTTLPLCAQHHHDMDRHAAHDALRVWHRYENLDRVRVSSAGTGVQLATRALACPAEVEDASRAMRELQSIRSRHRLSQAECIEHAIASARAFYRLGHHLEAYHLLRHANGVVSQTTPYTIRIELQLALADCLNHLGYARASAWLYLATAESGLARGLRTNEAAQHPVFRLAEAEFSDAEAARGQRLVEDAFDAFAPRWTAPRDRAYLSSARARFHRQGAPAEAVRILEDGLREVDTWAANFRQANRAQAKYLMGDRTAHIELSRVAKAWHDRMPFNAVIALIRAGIAALPLAMPLHIVPENNRTTSLAAFQNALALTQARDWSFMLPALHHNVATLELSLGHDHALNAARARQYASLPAGFPQLAPGPLLDQTKGLPRTLLLRPDSTGIVPLIDGFGPRLQGAAARNWF